MNSGYHKNLVFTAACIGMCFFGVSMITLGSVLPSLVTKLELSGLQNTSLVTFLPIGMLAGSLIFGPIADRFGHKALLVPSCIPDQLPGSVLRVGSAWHTKPFGNPVRALLF